MRVPPYTVPVKHNAPATAVVAEETLTSSATYTALKADLLIPGRGGPTKDGALVIQGDKIDWVGEYAQRPSKYANLKFQHVPVLMPGMWDCHTHFGGYGLAFPSIGDHKALLPGANSLAGAVTVADLKRTLEAGFTSVRELSGVRNNHLDRARLLCAWR